MMKENKMNMMELNEEQLEAVTGGGMIDDIMDAWSTLNTLVDTIIELIED